MRCLVREILVATNSQIVYTTIARERATSRLLKSLCVVESFTYSLPTCAKWISPTRLGVLLTPEAW
jgi:hypothetical protein